ncbi:conserved hypothetical protein [Mycobacterium marinum E11]|nr:conserved hypothetical protein [Mycobacterium marinum E11]
MPSGRPLSLKRGQWLITQTSYICWVGWPNRRSHGSTVVPPTSWTRPAARPLLPPGCALPRAVSSPGGQLAGLDVWPGDELVKLSGCFAASSSAAKVWKSVLPAAAVLLPLRDRTRDGAVARTGWNDTPATSEHLDQTAPMRSADQSERN